SHGLDQRRLDGVRVAAGGFTNLSRDHLDYHPTLEAYLAAKLRLFTDLIEPGGAAVIAADHEQAEIVATAARRRDLRLVTVGKRNGAKGRLELVGERNGAPIFVDYAHKPDALAKALQALRPYASRRLVVVFGCGGDRDQGKRPMMGAIAAKLADRVVVTDDNPRSEDP